MGWNGVITDVGTSILGQYAVPGSTLIITKVQTGKGKVSTSSMHESTALADPVTTGNVTGIRSLTSGSLFRLEIGPHTSTYALKEIGIFAKVGDGGTEGLLALIQHSGDGVDIPNSGDFPDFVLRLSVPMSISNSDDITYEIPPEALVSHEEFEDLEDVVAALDTAKKNVQTAVSDPTASGTSLTFIKSITQDTQGKITPAKATVSTMGAATASAAGTAGLVPKPNAGDHVKYLKGNGTWAALDIPDYNDMAGATSSSAGTHGLVPAPAAGDQDKFLKGDGNWAVVSTTDTKNTAGATDTSNKIFLIGATSQEANPQTYSQDTAYVGTDGCLYSGGAKVLTSHQDISGKKNTQTAVSDPSASGNSLTFIATISQNTQGVITATKKTVADMGAASSSAAGTAGLVPAPAAGKQGSYLRGDGTWATPTNTTYSEFTGATSSADGAAGLVKKPLKANAGQYLKGDGTWATPPDTDTKNTAGSTDTISKIFLIGATSQAANPQTYSQDTAYVGTDGCLYSGGVKVLTAHQDISGKKNTQTAVSDPTADGTSATFIATISQNTQGVITATKKTVRTMGAASSSAAGSTGLVPAPAKGDQAKFLRGDGTWVVPTNTTYSDFTAATSSAAGAHGLVPAPAAGDQAKFLCGNKTWAVPTDTKNTAGSTDTSSKIFLIGATSQAANPQTYSQDTAYVGTDGCLYSGGTKVLTSHQDISGKKNTQSAVSDPSASGTSLTFIKSISQNAQGVISPAKATVATMGAATSSAAGSIGLVPAPAAGKQGSFLRGDGTWQTPTNTTYGQFTGATSSADGAAGLVTKPLKANASQFLCGNGTWATPTNTTYSDFTAATSSAAGAHGLVPAPAAGDQAKFLCGNKTWAVPTNTDTKNTAGSTNTTSKIYLVGATSQAANPQTYSNASCYAYNGVLYSGGVQVLTSHQSLDSCVKTSGNQSIAGVKTFSDTTESSSTTTGAVKISGGLGVAKNIYGAKVYHSVWNDYAECRKADTIEPGRCVMETKTGVMTKTTDRLMPGCKITSDTYGACMGETDSAKTPIAVAGRVLVYPTRDRELYNLGDAVCSGPNGTVDIMTREEIREYPERIVGTVSEIPEYAIWVAGTKEDPKEIRVDGRIWVYVR